MRLPIATLKIHLPILLKSGLKKVFPFFFHNLIFRKHLAIIIITHKCNFKCIMCNSSPQISRVDNELTGDEWKTVISRLKELSIEDIHFTGGEPLLREDLSDLIRYAADLKFSVGVTTNGSLLTESRLEKMVSSGLSSMAVSLDAEGEDYENIRGISNSYSKIKDTLRLLSRYKISGKVKGYINFTLFQATLPHFKAVKRVADSLSLPVAVCLLDYTPYFFNRKENKARLWIKKEAVKELRSFIEFIKKEKVRKPDSLIINTSGIRYIDKYFHDPIQRDVPCIASQTRIFINPYGKVMGGCLSMGNFGDLRQSSLKEILDSDRLKESEKNMFYKKCPGCSCGYIYNLQHYLPALSKDFLKLGSFSESVGKKLLNL